MRNYACSYVHSLHSVGACVHMYMCSVFTSVRRTTYVHTL